MFFAPTTFRRITAPTRESDVDNNDVRVSR